MDFLTCHFSVDVLSLHIHGRVLSMQDTAGVGHIMTGAALGQDVAQFEISTFSD